MKITLEVPDNKAAFVMELLQSIPFIKAKAVRPKAQPQDETEYLLSNPANKKILLDSIAQLEKGQTVQHEQLD